MAYGKPELSYMILIFILLGGYVIILGGYVILLYKSQWYSEW